MEFILKTYGFNPFSHINKSLVAREYLTGFETAANPPIELLSQVLSFFLDLSDLRLLLEYLHIIWLVIYLVSFQVPPTNETEVGL